MGFNCVGADQLRPYVSERSRWAPFGVSAHPNAGLPNALGEYDESPEEMAGQIESLGARRSPQHRRWLLRHHPRAPQAHLRSGRRPPAARAQAPSSDSDYAGLEPLKLTGERLFINVGERTNMTGSACFEN